MDEKQKDKFRELRDYYYRQFDDLNEARPVLKGIDEAFLCFAQNILDEYKTEYMILQAKERIRAERELYKLNLEGHELIPRTWRSWKKFFRKQQNLAKVLLDKEVELDTQQFFKECLQRLAERERVTSEDEEEEVDVTGEESPEDPPERPQSAEEAPEDELQVVHVEEVFDLIAPPYEELEEDEEASEESDQEEDRLGENYGIDTEYEILEDDEEEEDDDDVEGDQNQ